MHSLFLGVIKSLFKLWMEDMKIFKSADLCNIDRVLITIKPPSSVPCPPMSIVKWNKWRSKDFLVFSIYYSLIIFKDFMPDIYYENLKKLVIFLEHLFVKNIEKSKLLILNKNIEEFVEEAEKIYGEQVMNSGFHELLHISKCADSFGHPNSSNCFVFEELNRKLTNLIKGKNLIGEEFIKVFTVSQTLNSNLRFLNSCGSNLKNFIRENSKLGTSNRKKDIYKRLSFTSSFEKENDPLVLNLLNNVGLEAVFYYTTKRVCFSGHLYTDFLSCSRFANCYIFNTSKSIFGIISKIVIYGQEVYFACTRIKKISPVVRIDRSCIESYLIYCKKTTETFLIHISLVSKGFFFEIGNKSYFSTLTLGHLFT